MRYIDSIVEVILIEREKGSTYKEIADKLGISIYKVKKVVMGGGSRIFKHKDVKVRKNKNGSLDNE